MKDFIAYFGEFSEFSIFLRLVFAVFFGGIIGLERRLRKRTAGIRTFSLVCAGSALAMITNEYLFLQYELVGDPGRMAAQVISGVGFLGAGTIILNGRKVKGLTTAASLWATAAIGIAVGSGFFYGAFFGFIVIFLSTTFMHRFEEKTNKNNKFIEIYIEMEKNTGMAELIKYITEQDFALYSIEKIEKKSDYICVCAEINLKRRIEHNEIIYQINLINSVNYAEEIE